MGLEEFSNLKKQESSSVSRNLFLAADYLLLPNLIIRYHSLLRRGHFAIRSELPSREGHLSRRAVRLLNCLRLGGTDRHPWDSSSGARRRRTNRQAKGAGGKPASRGTARASLGICCAVRTDGHAPWGRRARRQCAYQISRQTEMRKAG